MIRLGRPDDPTSTDRADPTIEIRHNGEKIAPAYDVTVFYNAPVVVLHAILTTFAAQKHEGILPVLDDAAQWGRSALQAVSETTPREIKVSSAFQD